MGYEMCVMGCLKGGIMARQGLLQVLGRQLILSTRRYSSVDYELIFTIRLEELNEYQ
jgi:hypothetical protein